MKMEYRNQAKADQKYTGKLTKGNFLLVNSTLLIFGPDVDSWRAAFKNSKFLGERLQKPKESSNVC